MENVLFLKTHIIYVYLSSNSRNKKYENKIYLTAHAIEFNPPTTTYTHIHKLSKNFHTRNNPEDSRSNCTLQRSHKAELLANLP